jgi:hypothetical protein
MKNQSKIWKVILTETQVKKLLDTVTNHHYSIKHRKF